jgi:hypothetical protein
MSDKSLSGIDLGGRANRDEAEPSDIRTLLDEYEVERISELSDKQMMELAGQLDEDEKLEGIKQRPEEGEKGSGIVRKVARLRARLQKQEVFQEQLEELQTVADNTEIFRRISATLSSVDQKLEANNELLADLVESTARGASLSVKDSERIKIATADTTRDVVDDTDVTTSSVIVKASIQNSGSIFIGAQEVEVGSGYELEPGETQTFPVDVVAENFKLSAESKGDTYSYVSLGLSQ